MGVSEKSPAALSVQSKILLVDDDETIGLSLGKMLEHHNRSVKAAANVSGALKLMRIAGHALLYSWHTDQDQTTPPSSNKSRARSKLIILGVSASSIKTRVVGFPIAFSLNGLSILDFHISRRERRWTLPIR